MFSQISWSGTLKIEIEGNRGNLRLSHNGNLSSAKPRIRAPPLFRDQKSPNHFALGSVTEPVSHKLTVVTQLRVERSNLEIGKTSMGAAPKKRTTSLFPISLSSFFPPNREREKGSERKKGGKGTRTWRKGRLPFLVRSIPGNSHSIFSTTWLREAPRTSMQCGSTIASFVGAREKSLFSFYFHGGRGGSQAIRDLTGREEKLHSHSQRGNCRVWTQVKMYFQISLAHIIVRIPYERGLK